MSFLLAALIPMGGMAWYSYRYVDSLLLKVNRHRLEQDSETFGMSLIGELALRANNLKRSASHLAKPTETPSGPLYGFDSVSNQARPVLNAKQRSQLDRGNVVLQLGKNGLARFLAPIADSNRVLVGDLDRTTLWRNDYSPEQFCILSANLASLYCTQGMKPPTATKVPGLAETESRGVFPWQIGPTDYLVGYWHTHFLPQFVSPGFVVLVATPKRLALHDLDRFRHVFPAVVLLALALAAGLAINQIRRQMRPLEQLEEGTRRLAAGDLTTRVTLSREDELTSLGRAFNSMAQGLEYKFHMLDLLARLDRDILGASELDYVIREILSYIRQAIPCDGAGLLRLNEKGNGILLTSGQAEQEPPQFTGIVIRAPAQPELTPGQNWGRMAPDEPNADFLLQLAEQPVKLALVFPISVDERLNSLLLLAYETTPENEEEIIRSGRSLADRLAIASSNFAWEEKLYRQAHYDALTGLPNRVLLRDRVQQALVRANRNQTSVALLLIDLDNFKQINDSLGHSAGDALLSEYSRRLLANVRGEDTIARLGGDEFVVLVSDLIGGDEYFALDSIARKLSKVFSKPVLLGGQPVVSPASIGIAIYPEAATSFEELLKFADAAMYESKRLQPGGFRFYSDEINIQTLAHFELSQELREAVAKKELVLYFQPKVHAATSQIAGAEALVRWDSPKRGLVSPGLFLPLLDEMGLATWLGEFVLDTVCAQMRDWDQQGLPPIPISINLSPIQFERTPVLEKVREALDKYGLTPARLELEILEETAVTDSTLVRESLTQLREFGIDIALDDFGTGYSSLVYLARIPANVLKLDRAFIRTLATDDRQQEIVKLIISLAKVLAFSVVAEGVEEEKQLSLLTEMGCDLIQGYLISRPVPAEEFAEVWLH